MSRTLITCAGTLGILMSSAAALASTSASAERLDALHRLRDADSARREGLALAEHIERNANQDYELMWRAARVHCWESEVSRATSPSASTSARRCWRLADAATELDSGRPEGFIYAAQGMGLWARANGKMAAVAEGLEGKFFQRVDKAMRLDASADRGAAWLMRGAFFYEVPWPKRDLRRAQTLFSRAVERFPENLRVRLYLARIEAETGSRKRALAQLATIEAADPQYDPPSARRVKAEARSLAEKLRTN